MVKKIAAFITGGLALLCIYLFALYLRTDSSELIKSTLYAAEPGQELSYPTALPFETAPPVTSPTPAVPTIVPTTISGGMSVKNTSGYDIDLNALCNEGCPILLEDGKPQILIIHTHSSEAYSPAGLDKYDDLGTNRTLDSDLNVIRVGSELTQILSDCGLQVIHDTQVFDYPSYTGSYDRSCEAVKKHLAENPSIKIVIDLHRDALCSDTVTYKTAASEDGSCASQVMLFVGSDACGLEHPDWQKNLRLAVYLQDAVCRSYPSLMRPITLTKYRYNQHLAPGSVILEVGSNGNTLQEALAAIRLFGKAAGPALAELIDK